MNLLMQARRGLLTLHSYWRVSELSKVVAPLIAMNTTSILNLFPFEVYWNPELQNGGLIDRTIFVLLPL